MLSSRRILRWLLPASTRARVHGQVQCRMVINSGAPVSLRGPFGISCPRRATGNSSADRLRGRCVRTRSGKTGWRGLRVEGEASNFVSWVEICGWEWRDIWNFLFFSLERDERRGKCLENFCDFFQAKKERKGNGWNRGELESSDRQFLKFSREEISWQSNWQKLGIYHPCISTSSTYEYIFIRERVKQGVQDRRLIIYQANS